MLFAGKAKHGGRTTHFYDFTKGGITHVAQHLAGRVGEVTDAAEAIGEQVAPVALCLLGAAAGDKVGGGAVDGLGRLDNDLG